MGTLAERLARTLVMGAQFTPFKGMGGYSPEAFAAKGQMDAFPQASREAQYFEDFFPYFRGRLTHESLADKVVLDFGCGYGGRTVEYAVRCKARRVIGVEPEERHINLARQYAASRGVSNVDFELCTQSEIPLPDESLDAVVSYDVLEHVNHPGRSLQEIHRVLRVGGVAYLVFPVYDGALSHHLDYIARVPGLHWLFSPTTLINAVNSILVEDRDLSRYGTSVQPQPRPSFDGRRLVLPTLNGMTGSDFERLAQPFSIEHLYFRPLLARRRFAGAPFRAAMHLAFTSRMRDALTTSVVSILRKVANEPKQRDQ